MKTILLAAALSLASLMPAYSQEVPSTEVPEMGKCDKRAVIFKSLKDRFGLHHFSSGIAGALGDSLFETTVSESRKWVILHTTKRGNDYRSCIIAWGTGFALAPVGQPT